MDTLQVNNENKSRRKKSDERRSSILKIDRPTLADLDMNRKTETKISRRSSKRVSFAETYQVKEFPKDSPQRWLRDLHNADNETDDKESDGSKTPAGSGILGLDQLLNGQIQSGGEENDTEKLNKTIMDGVDMEETVCGNTSIRQNTTLSNTVCQEDLEEGRKVDTLSFLNSLMKKSQSDGDCEPFLKPPEDSDEEEYKASSFFRGGSDGFFGKQSETNLEGKVDNKSFLAKLQSINTSSQQFAQEREKREKSQNQTIVFDGLDDDMEMTANFTATLQSFKKRQSTGNMLESTRIYADTEDAMEMTRNLTTNLEVVRSNLPISDFEVSKIETNTTGVSKPGTSTILGKSANRGFDQTRVFSDYEDPTANMDFTVARGEILNSTVTPTAPTMTPGQSEGSTVNTDTAKQQTGTGAPQQANKPEVPTPCPEVTINFGLQEVDADMEMTEALDPTLVVANQHSGLSAVTTAKDKLQKSSRALADVTAHFEGDGLTARKAELLNVEKRRKLSVSPVEMGKENVSVHFKSVDVQAEVDITSSLTTKVECQKKENMVVVKNIQSGPSPDKTQVFHGSEDVAGMDFTSCLTTQVEWHNKENMVVNKQPSPCPEKTQVFHGSEAVANMDLISCLTTQVACQDEENIVVKEQTRSDPSPEKTQVFHGSEDIANMEFTSCLTTRVECLEKENVVTIDQTGSGVSPEKATVFDGSENMANMEFTACIETRTNITTHVEETISFKNKENPPEGSSSESDDRGVTQIKIQAEESSSVHRDVTRVFGSGDETAVMELTECQTQQQKKTVVEVKVQQRGVESGDKTRVFDTGDTTASMELTECASLKKDTSKCKTEDRTVHFDKREGSMELTVCHTGLVSVPVSGECEKTKISNNLDVTAAVEIPTGQTTVLTPEPEPNTNTEAEFVDSTVRTESSKIEVSSVKGRLSLPNRVGESMQGKTAENVQQRRSFYTGMVNSAAPAENFSTQSLKRKLYSFDMMMAGAKAKSVKIAKLKDTSESDIVDDDVKKPSPEKSISSDEPIAEQINETVPEMSQSKEPVEDEAPPSNGEMVKSETLVKLIKSVSLDGTEPTHSSTEILKMGTSDQEVSALEVLKNLALEEDTLDDTKLLELRMMAKKNNSDNRPKPIAGSPLTSPQKKTLTDKNTELGNGKQSIEEDEEENLTLDNTTTALSVLLSKMNKTKTVETSSVLEKKSTVPAPTSPVVSRGEGSLVVGKHGSPDPICSGNKKKPKLEENVNLEKPIAASEDATLDSIKQPVEMVDENDTVTSLDSTNSEESREHTRAHQSQSAMSLSQSLLSYSIVDRKYDETEGPWDFETFCERMGISQFRPKCNRRSSFNIQPAVEANSLQEILQLQTVTVTEDEVKGEVYKTLKDQLDRDEEQIEEQQKSVLDKQPVLFSQLRNSEISQEEVHSCYKACHRWAKAKLKKERVAISNQCLQRLKVEKDHLCSGIDEVVTQAERVIADLASVDTMLVDIDRQLEEIKSEPALSEAEAKEVAHLQDSLHHKQQELKKNENEKAELLNQFKESQQKQKSLESECQKQELQLLKQGGVADPGQLADELQLKLAALERVLEWQVKELSPSRDMFLFLYGVVKLSVSYDVVQQRTLDSVSLTSHIAESSSPWSQLACRLIVNAVDCSKLRQRYPSRDKLPQLLHEVSSLVASARSLASEISHIDLRHHVAINDYSVEVSLLNTQKVQKVVLTFKFEPACYTCRPTHCLLDVVVGKIQKEKVEDVLKETLKFPECLTKCISVVQNVLNS